MIHEIRINTCDTPPQLFPAIPYFRVALPQMHFLFWYSYSSGQSGGTCALPFYASALAKTPKSRPHSSNLGTLSTELGV